MRTATKSTLGLVSLGLFAASYQVGLSAETGFSLADPAANAATSPTPSTSSTPSTSATPSTSPTPSTSSTTTTSTPAPKESTASSGSTSGATSGSTSTASVSQTSAAIDTGKGYGFVQVEVVKTNGKISAINMVRAEATDGRAGAFPSLVAAAVAANGTGFGNVSGATYTTNAFKKAVESALAKF